MTIDWQHFTPWTSLAGGVLIGLASALFIMLNGRILGISGIIGGLLTPRSNGGISGLAWRLAFLLGLCTTPWAFILLTQQDFQAFQAYFSSSAPASGLLLVMIAGLLVGFGTRLGSGCTSGHGICGLSRLSLRSLAATLAFMLAGFATVYGARHLL